MTSPTICYIEV